MVERSRFSVITDSKGNFTLADVYFKEKTFRRGLLKFRRTFGHDFFG